MDMVGCGTQTNPANAYYFLEVRVPGVAGGQTGTIFYFPSNIEQLNGARIDRIWTLPSYYSAFGPSKAPSGATILYASSSQAIYFTLKVSGYDLISNMEYVAATGDPAGGYELDGLRLNGVVIDWSTSYILLNPAPGNTVDNSVCFIVRYWKK